MLAIFFVVVAVLLIFFFFNFSIYIYFFANRHAADEVCLSIVVDGFFHMYIVFELSGLVVE